MTKLPKGTCRCGNTVLLFKRGDETQGISNAPDSDRLTYHDDLAGAACPHGGKLLAEVLLGAEFYRAADSAGARFVREADITVKDKTLRTFRCTRTGAATDGLRYQRGHLYDDRNATFIVVAPRKLLNPA